MPATAATPHHRRSSAANCGWDGDLQRRNAVENFRAMVMKFAASDPTRPLTDARRALIEKRLREEGLPHFHTPNHPPYSAMIHRAIGELNELEGCTKDSISKFITGHYDDLPWSHSTLLNHHLQKLCECGEIVVTSDNCYLVSDGITNLESTHCSTPGRVLVQGKQKRLSKKQSGQARCFRKDQTKEKIRQGELMEVICGKSQVQEYHNLVTEGQNLAAEPLSEMIEEPYKLEAQEQEQQSVLIRDYNQQGGKTMDSEHLLEGKTMDSEHLEVNQQEVLSPERPRGFDVEVVKELSEFQQQQLPEDSLFSCSQKNNPKCQLETTTTYSGLHINSKQVLLEQQCEHRPRGFAMDLPLVKQKQQPDYSNSERPLELGSQEKSCKSLDGLEPLESAEKFPGKQQPQGKKYVRKKGAKSRPEVFLTEDAPMNSNKHFEIPKAGKSLGSKPAAVVSSPKEQLPLGKLCLRQKASTSEPPPSPVPLSLPKQPDGKRKRTGSKTKIMRREDLSLHSEQIAEIQNTGKCHGPETRPVEPCIHEEVQRVKHRKRSKEPQYILALEAVTAARGLAKDSNKQPDVLVSKQSSQRKRRGRPLQDRGQKMSMSTPPMTSKTKLFSLAGIQYPEIELPDQESSTKSKQILVDESTQRIDHQANLPGHEKMTKSQSTRNPSEHLKQHEQRQQVVGQKGLPLSKPKTRRSSLDSRLASQKEPEQPPASPNCERGKERHYQLAPENSKDWCLWPQQAKSAPTTAGEVVFVQDKNERRLDSQDGGSFLGPKFDKAQDVVEPSQSHPQDQNEQKPLAPRGRGRPRKRLHKPLQQEKQIKCRDQGRHHKRKPDDARMQNQVQEPKRRGRPRKLDK